MDAVNTIGGVVPAEAASSRRQPDSSQPKDAPFSGAGPQPQSRGEAVVFGGSLANLDRSSNTRDAERQRRIERKEDMEVRRQDADERREARRVDVKV